MSAPIVEEKLSDSVEGRGGLYGVDGTGWSLIDFTADLTGRTSEPSSTPALLLILSKQKIFRYFMHMRAKTICGF